MSYPFTKVENLKPITLCSSFDIRTRSFFDILPMITHLVKQEVAKNDITLHHLDLQPIVKAANLLLTVQLKQ